IRLVEYIKQIIDKHKQNPKKISLLLMGIKHFQEINDTLGHHNGDILLKQVAQRLDDNLGKSGMLARTGADIFSFVMLGANCADVDDYFQAIKALLREPFIIGGINIDVSMSFGVASYPEHG